MILGHIILHARRQKLHLIDFPWTEMLAHGPNQNQTRHQNASDYSDRLLAARQTASARTATPDPLLWPRLPNSPRARSAMGSLIIASAPVVLIANKSIAF